MSDPGAGSRKGMRDGFSIRGECPKGMWEQEPGSGRAQAKECGGVSDRSGGDGMVEGDLETGRASGLERCRKRNPTFVPNVRNALASVTSSTGSPHPPADFIMSTLYHVDAQRETRAHE